MGRLGVTVLCTWLCALATADANDRKIAVLALRPTVGESQQDAPKRLPEAAALTSLIESVVTSAGGTAVRGGDLEKPLGAGYLGKVRACKEKAPCVSALLQPLQETGVTSAIVGRYAVTGKTYRIELFLISIADGKVASQISLELADSELKDPAKWRTKVEALVQAAADQGTIIVTSSVADAECTVDGEPCTFRPDRRTIDLPAGQHTLVLSKAGFKSVTRTVEVSAGSEADLGFELISDTAGPPTRPEQALPGKAAAGYVGPKMIAYAHIEWAALIDPLNRGNDPDPISLPESISPRDWNVGLNPYMHFGFIWIDEKRSGWQAKGIINLGMFTFRQLRFAHAIARLDNDEKGIGFGAGRHYHPTVNPVEPGTTISYYGFGSLSHSFNGVIGKKALGPLVVQTGIGRPETVLLGETPALQGSVGSLFVEASVALNVKSKTGILYGQKTPLQIIASGGAGYHRFGAGERLVTPTATTPVLESLPVWIAGGQAVIPFSKLMFVASAYIGKGAGIWGASIFQTHHIDPTTGEHSLLKSAGGFGQVSARVSPRLEIVAVYGMDRVLTGFKNGVSPSGLDIRSNEWKALILNVQLSKSFRLALQGHHVTSEFRGLGRSSHPGAVVSFLMRFGL